MCGDVQSGLNHEWLVTNGLGGYAAGSIAGATTRSYHGLLVAALRPPVERTILVTKIDEEIELPGGQQLKLGVNEYHDGTIDPQGYQYLESVSLEGDMLYFIYRLEDNLTLHKRVWMEYGQNTTYVQYTLHGAHEDETDETPLILTLSPFCLSRDHHVTTQGAADWHFLVDNEGNLCRVRAFDGAPIYYLIAGPAAHFTATGVWYWRVLHRRDVERGLPSLDDVYQPGTFRVQIVPGERATLVLSTEERARSEFGEPQHEENVVQALARHQRRTKQLLAVADRTISDLPQCDPVRARLVIAADQFIVARPQYTEDADGNRHLHLSPEQKTIIAGYPWFTDWGRDSMISLPGLLLATGRYSEARGLLKAFASFTHEGLIPNRFPDSGEAPEYNTVDATQYSQIRSQVQQNYTARFWYERGGYLYDVVDVEGIAGQNDASLRPNQLFAAALTNNLLSEAQVRSMLQHVTEQLLTPLGLRTLSPEDPAYRSHFNGNREQRDGAYHQGTVWPWLIGPYIDMHFRVYKDRKALRPLLQPLVEHLWDACLGTISEVAEPEPPFTPAGCFAQAWSVSELLRCWILATG